MEARGQRPQALLQEGDGARQRLVPEADEDQQQDDQDDAADGHHLHQMQDRADSAVPGAVKGRHAGEDEADENHDVEQALDHDGADDGKPRDGVAPAEEIGAHQLAEPGRQQVIRGIAHKQAIEHLAEAKAAHGRQQNAPPPTPQHEGDPIEGHRRRQPGGPDLAELGAQPGEIDPGDGEPEQRRAHGEADEDLEQAMAREPPHRPKHSPHHARASINPVPFDDAPDKRRAGGFCQRG